MKLDGCNSDPATMEVSIKNTMSKMNMVNTVNMLTSSLQVLDLMGKIGPKFSHLLMVRAEGADPFLTVKSTC